MSTLKTTLQVAGVVAFAAAAGTTYVLIHEHRRRSKKGRKAEGDCAVSGAGSSCNSLQPEQLVRLLTECAHSAYQLIEQVLMPLCPSSMSRDAHSLLARRASPLGCHLPG